MLSVRREHFVTAAARLLASFLFLLLAVSSATSQTKAVPGKGRLLLASDIHFNPMADPALMNRLLAAPPERWQGILQRSRLTAFSQYGHDTNWWLLRSTLDQMRATLPHPAMLIVTGDLLAHQFPQTFANITHDPDRAHYRSFVLKTVQFIALELRKRFPQTTVLLTPGNNDDDCGDYAILGGATFLTDTSALMRGLAHGSDTFATDWRALGSYNVANPAVANARIISLNTVFYSQNYNGSDFLQGCAAKPADDGSRLLQWLDANLEQARAANQKVWLMFHIPPGIDGYSSTRQNLSQLLKTGSADTGGCSKAIVPMWVPDWTTKFDELLQKYSGTVVASFAGHTHVDDFRLIGAGGDSPAFILVDPPVSPVYMQNPSFRVIDFAADGALTDQSTYYLTNLDEASKKVRGVWRKEYTFTEEWKLDRLDAASLATLYQRIVTDQATRERWFDLYSVSAVQGLPPDIERGLYCAVEGLSVPAYQACYCIAPAAPVPAAQ